MPDVTLPLEDAIQNPNNPNHLMVIRPVSQRIRIYVGEEMIAETNQAIRIIEVGKTFYDPTVYVPADALTGNMEKTDKSTHCPIKGDAAYYLYKGDEISWAYPSPLDMAKKLTGFHAFWPQKVRIEEGI